MPDTRTHVTWHGQDHSAENVTLAAKGEFFWAMSPVACCIFASKAFSSGFRPKTVAVSDLLKPTAASETALHTAGIYLLAHTSQCPNEAPCGYTHLQPRLHVCALSHKLPSQPNSSHFAGAAGQIVKMQKMADAIKTALTLNRNRLGFNTTFN